MDGPAASATDIAAPQHHQIYDQLTNTCYARMRIYCMQVQTCPVWNWYGIVEFHLRLQFYSIPVLVETPSVAFSAHSLLKMPNSRIIPTLTFQFQSPGLETECVC